MGLDKINDMRRSLGWGLEELSKKSGVPISTLSKIAAGVTKDPKLETIKSIVYCMGYTLDDLDSKESKNTPASATAETGELDKQEQTLIYNYRALNDEGQEKLLDYSQDLVSSGRYLKEETVRVFRAAHSVENKDTEIVEVPKSLIDKLKAAKPAEEI